MTRSVVGRPKGRPRARARGEAQSAKQPIVENCGNTLILRCSASEGGGTARFASGLIGEREVLREQITESRGGGMLLARNHRSVNTSTHHVTESAVLASEIEQLPDLQGLLKFASTPDYDAQRRRTPERPPRASEGRGAQRRVMEESDSEDSDVKPGFPILERRQ
jgi:hypothetical protein